MNQSIYCRVLLLGMCFHGMTWGQSYLMPVQPSGSSDRPGYYLHSGQSAPTTIPGPVPPLTVITNDAMPVANSVSDGFGVMQQATADCDSCADAWQDACDGSCSTPCGSQCVSGCGFWSHRTFASAGLLYIRPRNAEVAYAVPIDGPIVSAPANNPAQIGGIGVVDPDYDAGFDVKLNLAVNPMTSLYAAFQMLDTTTDDAIRTSAPNVIRSIVSHPASTSASTDFLSAMADLDLAMDTVDVGIRHLLVGGDAFAINYLVGARYGRLEQRFAAEYVDNGVERVLTDIDFDGVGFRLGLEADRMACGTPLWIYSRSSVTLLAGKFQASYFQGQSFDPTVVSTSWEAGRITPVLDLEVGAGWHSSNGRLHLSAGYLVSAWLNTVQTQDFIHSVQQNEFRNLGDTLTFDGLTARLELTF